MTPEEEEFKEFKKRFVEKFKAENPVPEKKVKKGKKGVWVRRPGMEGRRHRKKPGPPRKRRKLVKVKDMYCLEEPVKKVYTGKGWPPWIIRAKLSMLQESSHTISFALGVKKSYVQNVMSRSYIWPTRIRMRIEMRISDLLGEDYEDVWGEEKPFYFARYM